MGGAASMLITPHDPSEIMNTIRMSNEIADDFTNKRSEFGIVNHNAHDVNKHLVIGSVYVVYRRDNHMYYICRVSTKSASEIILCFCGFINHNVICIAKESKELYYVGYKYDKHPDALEFENFDNFRFIDIYSNGSQNRFTINNSHIVSDNYLGECSICYNDYSIGDCISTTKCNHVYHQKCLQKWFQTKMDCPICRQSCK